MRPCSTLRVFGCGADAVESVGEMLELFETEEPLEGWIDLLPFPNIGLGAPAARGASLDSAVSRSCTIVLTLWQVQASHTAQSPDRAFEVDWLTRHRGDPPLPLA